MAGELRFLDILSALARHEVAFVVVGGVAAILEGAPISTFDLDIVFHRTTENNLRLATVLQELNASYKDPAGRHIVPDSTKLDSINVHLLRTDLGPLDLLSRVGRNLTYEALLDRSIDYEVAGLQLKVLNLETVIECKEIADRDKDRAALPILRRTLELKRSGDD
ncbi:MAG TPA: hypothetical protein VFE33_01785 [Thermoanaerobaculia bacterium]|nr:hypothetical protein [Thermoanaerobaculia bacterium]